MSLVIETQFAALTVEESDLSRTESNPVLGTGTGGDTGAAGDSALNLRTLEQSLPNMTTGDGTRWIKSCMFILPDMHPIRFRMRVTTQFRNLKRGYYRMSGLRSAVFVYRDREVADSDTPERLEMENGFKLEVFET